MEGGGWQVQDQYSNGFFATGGTVTSVLRDGLRLAVVLGAAHRAHPLSSPGGPPRWRSWAAVGRTGSCLRRMS